MGEFSPISTFHSSVQYRFYSFVAYSDGSVEFRAVVFQQTAEAGQIRLHFLSNRILQVEKHGLHPPQRA